MVLQNKIMVKIKGSKNFVVCAREGGANTTPYFLSVLFALQKMNPVVGEKANPKPARIPPQTPPAGRKPVEAKRKILSPRKKDFRFAESVLKPHALPEYLEGRTPKEKHPFLFQKKFHPRQIRNARSVFSFGVAGVLASAWGFLRIICFESRFELCTINTPTQNSTAFSKPEGGAREGRPTGFPPFFQTDSEFLARWRAPVFSQGGGSKSEAILTNSIYLIQKEFLLL